MISNREIDSSIDTSEVKNIFNKKYKWQKYNSVYHAPVTYYYWNKYNLEYTTSDMAGRAVYYQPGTVKTFYSSSVFNANKKTFDVSGGRSITISSENLNAPIGLYDVTIGDKYFRNSSYYIESLFLCSDNSINYNIGAGSMIEYSKGTYAYPFVSSTYRSTYPDNGRKDGYWYEYIRSGTSSAYYSKGSYIEDVEAKEENAYPTNGRHTDGFWYVKIE